MRIIAASDVQAALDFPALVEALRDAFRREISAPARHRYAIERAGEPDAALLLMPAWQSGRHIGIRIATVTPGNAERSLPTEPNGVSTATTRAEPEAAGHWLEMYRPCLWRARTRCGRGRGGGG